MNKCAQVRKLMSRYLDNELSGPEQEAVNLHLAACAECRHEYEMLNSEEGLLRSAPLPEISPYFTARTIARISALKPAPILRKLVWQTAVSVLVLAGIGLGIMLGSSLATGSSTSPELAALNSEPSIEELFVLEPGGR